jgi:hypothetical protein
MLIIVYMLMSCPFELYMYVLMQVLSIHSDKANGDTLLFVALRSPDSGTSVLASSLRVFLLTAPQHSTESITLCATFIQQFPLDFRPISLQILSSQTMSFLLVTGSDDFILHIYHIERDGRLSRNQDVRESLRMQWEHRLDLVSMKYKSVCLHIMIEDHHGIGSQGLATFSNGCLVFDHSSYKDISVSGRKYTDSTVHKGIDQLKTSHLTLLFDGVISCVKCISLAEQSISGASSRHRFSSLAIVGLSTGKVFIVGLITDSRLELDPVGGHGGVQAIAASNTISDLAIAVGYFDGTVSMYVFYPYRSAFIKTWQYVFPFPVYSLFTRVSPQTNSNIIIVTTAKTIHLLENCV